MVLFPGTSACAIFFTTARGTCSKCVERFRAVSFDFVIHEQYQGARPTGHFLDRPTRNTQQVVSVLEWGRWTGRVRMPRAVVDAGLACAVLPPVKIARRIALRAEEASCR